jgi:hypothetical protein
MEIVQFHTLWNVVLQIVCAPTTVINAPLLCTITGLVFTEWFVYSECIFFVWRFLRKASQYLKCVGYTLICIETLKWGNFGGFSKYLIKHYFICRPSDCTVSDDLGIEPRTVKTLALPFRLG